MPFLKFLRTCKSSASIESEISSGVTAPISKPAGAFIFLIYESAKPFSASLAFNEENFLLLPTNETNVGFEFIASDSAFRSLLPWVATATTTHLFDVFVSSRSSLAILTNQPNWGASFLRACATGALPYITS